MLKRANGLPCNRTLLVMAVHVCRTDWLSTLGQRMITV